jgi:hypothetical protein
LGFSPPITRCLDAFLCVASSSWVERVEVAAAKLFHFSPVQLIRYDHRLLFPSFAEVKRQAGRILTILYCQLLPGLPFPLKCHWTFFTRRPCQFVPIHDLCKARTYTRQLVGSVYSMLPFLYHLVSADLPKSPRIRSRGLLQTALGPMPCGIMIHHLASGFIFCFFFFFFLHCFAHFPDALCFPEVSAIRIQSVISQAQI